MIESNFNLIYIILLIIFYSIAAFLIKELIWKKESPSLWIWLVFFNIIGAYYNYFLSPDLISFVWNGVLIFFNIKVNSVKISILRTSLGLMAFGGFILIFNAIIDEITKRENMTKELKKEQWKKVIIIFLIYLVYLNIITNFLNFSFTPSA